MNGYTLLFSFSMILSIFFTDKVYAQELLTISNIVNVLEKSNEFKMQEENIKQSIYLESAVDGILDGKLSTKLFKYSSELYPNPPISLDSKKEGYGLAVAYDKMTSYGVKFGVGIGFEDKELGTSPTNTQFSMDAIDSVYSATVAVPLLKNFGSREYHLKKMVASKQKDGLSYKAKNEKDNLISNSISIYWSIIKLMQEKEIADKSLSRFNSLHKHNLVKRKSGIISRAELLTSEVEIINRKKNVKNLISKIHVEKIKLKTLMEVDILPTMSIDEMRISKKILDLTETDVEMLIDNGLIQTQMQSNKDLFDSLFQVEKEATKSSVDLFLSAKSFGRGQNINESFQENTQEKFEVYGGISWSFDVNNKKNTSNLATALSRKRQAILKEKQFRLKLKNGFTEIKEKIKSNFEQVLFLEKIRNQQKDILTAEKKRFKNGKISTLDYVKLQESYDKSSLQIIGLSYFNEVIGLKLFSTIGSVEAYLANYSKGMKSL